MNSTVQRALAEDIGNGDVTASLVPENERGHAHVISRDAAVICGRPWVDVVFHALDASVEIAWLIAEGEQVVPEQKLFTLKGP
ncbi:MAG: carboxylating nicotinate-nucleotide diphosphorylase, partial [Stenotrophobium sp.]